MSTKFGAWCDANGLQPTMDNADKYAAAQGLIGVQIGRDEKGKSNRELNPELVFGFDDLSEHQLVAAFMHLIGFLQTCQYYDQAAIETGLQESLDYCKTQTAEGLKTELPPEPETFTP
jgi:hypothetical protein